MNEKQLLILKNEFNLELPSEVVKKFEIYNKLFLDYNSHTNLMSKGDLELLFEKHIFDSLAILKYENFNSYLNDSKVRKKILDVGTGGGFPSLILAICFENLEITGVDSICKKINFINLAIKELGLKNLKTICGRVEDVEPQNVDIITSRAVGKIGDIFKNSIKHIKPDGEFIFYKATPEIYEKEIEELKNLDYAGFNNNLFKKFIKNPPNIVNYTLPTKEKHKRTLLVFKI